MFFSFHLRYNYHVKRTIEISSVITSSFYLILLGGVGTYLLINFTYPFLWQRWLFFGAIILLGTGIGLPVILFLNKVISSHHVAYRDIIVRESVGFGVYIGFLFWLAIGRLFTIPLAIAVGLIMLVIDYLLRIREFNVEPEEDVT